MWSISNRYSGNRFGCDFEGQYSRKTIYNPTKRTNFNPSTQYHNRELEINELKTEQIIIMKYFIKYVLASFFIYDWNITISITTLRKNDVPTKLWINIDIFSNFPKRWIIRPISRDNNQFGLQQLISATSRDVRNGVLRRPRKCSIIGSSRNTLFGIIHTQVSMEFLVEPQTLKPMEMSAAVFNSECAATVHLLLIPSCEFWMNFASMWMSIFKYLKRRKKTLE